jgi:YrbI family 3-deoxy-D-manno-octulosonate 8-phosphate phosphatase
MTEHPPLPIPHSPLASLARRCRPIELLVLDVDGVLTDGGIVYGSAGLEVKAFHVRDGSGLKLWHRAGRHSALLTGRTSEVVEVRARELGVATVIQGAADKWPAFVDLLARTKMTLEAVCYVGDDVPDVRPMRHSGLAVAVADACAEARACAQFVTRASGGAGAVREAIELLLRCQGLWAAGGL